LHLAATNENDACVRLLLRAGAPTGFADQNGLLPWEVAYVFQRKEPLIAIIRQEAHLQHFSCRKVLSDGAWWLPVFRVSPNDSLLRFTNSFIVVVVVFVS
jgi:hypothetical protein